MKYSLILLGLLFASWCVWSGHFDNPFLLSLGVLSSFFCLWLSLRMKIVDEEGTPLELGILPLARYIPYLGMEVVKSNLTVAKIILSRDLPLRRCVVTTKMGPKTELGRVILANSITLTPGTVSICLDDDNISIHALSQVEADEDIAGEMDRKVCELEGAR
ncbi:putative monovalent cation/H+ antiporter subunit E [Novipirellula aureliae]|uniref:Putative monovalent cation/H+ antiporter subunit E n=1 Tax=Novipirellula aureliae TaxID=2527966 RepID=A0A5C6DNP5_9BACT|nr:Na+/H+ antiporter subunit E [Novipirellula aureliae]TWU37815.1 putative monovalent cation/H+ antiporter subunit E [Novipirellula aureliae]